MSARAKLIAGQAGVVAILIAIAYFVFLKGDDPGSLSGIDAPGGDVQVEAPEPDTGKSERRAPDNQASRPGADRARPAGAGPGASPASGASRTVTATRPPSDDQYSDTVQALEAKLKSGGASINAP